MVQVTKKGAVSYWELKEDECGLSVDWAEGHNHCWRCGCERSSLHLHCIDGDDRVYPNLVVLCRACGNEADRYHDLVNTPEKMFEWFRREAVPFYNTFWAVAYYESINSPLPRLSGGRTPEQIAQGPMFLYEYEEHLKRQAA